MTTPCELVQIEYQGNGTLSVFAFPFPYDFKTEVKVALWNNTTKKHVDILTTDATYPWEVNDANPTAVTFTGTVPPSPPASDVNEDPIYNVRIYRVTDMTDIRSVFNQGSAIRATDLNKNFEQLRYAIQEGKCQIPDKLLEYLDEYYWNNYSDVVYSNETWVSNDQTIATTAALDARFQDEANETILSTETWVSDNDHIATTAALDARFQDELSETITSSESWPNNDDTIATTAKIDDVIDLAIENDILIDATGLTKSASGGQTTIGIGANSVDLDRIKTADIVQTSAYSSTWDSVDDKVATVGALAARLDAVVSTSQPTTLQTGKFWYNPTEGINALYMWNGTDWKVLTSGTPYIPAGTTIVRYVDAVNGSDASGVSGFLPQSPLRSIKRAITLINASATGDGTLVVVEPGVYQEALPLTIQKNNISVVGKSLRSCFIHPTVATENNNMWEVDSGTYISGFTMLGLKVPTSDQGSRNNAVDNDATYGLPSNQPFAVSFRSGNPVILKSPYVQNCTHFSDAHFDNANFDPNTFPSTDAQTYSAVAGDETSAPCGGGLLVDGSVPATTSPIRSMVVDAFTQITLDGPGILVTNNGYAQLVSFFGTFCHYHAKAKNGGQINLSNCVTDFGRYGLIAEGKSPTAIASATASAASSGATTVTIGAITSAGSFHGTVSRPLDHMMLTVDGNDYGVVSSVANGSGWDVTITPALSQTISNTAVTFALRSYISTGGHTFEYVGVGTDYSDHPDNGGVAIEANQVKQLSGGKVWQSSTDHIGKFKAGTVLTVDQIAETLAVNGSITVTGTNAINGNITVTGTVDGRDVATDGTKLDGIETGATADQTNAEIRTAVEAATDSNVFTDADHTKLNGIATGATAYANSDVDAHLNQSTASSGELLSWNGSDYDWIAAAAGYSDSSVDTHLNRSTAATGEVLSWNGSDYDWVASGGLTNNSDQTESIGLGPNALDSETSGTENTALGSGAGTNVTTGSSNTLLGRAAGTGLTTGGSNVIIGIDTAEEMTTASGCTLVGGRAGFKNNADSVTYIGSNAGQNVSGSEGTIAIGKQALASSSGQNPTGIVAIGFESLKVAQTAASNNTTLGYRTLKSTTSGSNNTALGASALYSNTTGASNVAVGASALYANTTGTDNVAVGQQALIGNTTGSYNTATGKHALFTNSTGTQNTATGYFALNINSTGSYNTATGLQAMRLNTTGSNNAATGYQALYSNTTGSSNVANGYQALYHNTTASNNVASGYKALFSNTTGVSNIASGAEALLSNTTGGYNLANGAHALRLNTTGTRNVANGTFALTTNTTGNDNIASGHSALQANTTGSSNTAYGYLALYSNTTGGNNIANGHQALYVNTTASNNIATGYRSLYSNTTGANNVAIGAEALKSNTTASYNTSTGYHSSKANTTGNHNVASGYETFFSNTTGSFNAAYGIQALRSNTTASNNTAFGTQALYSNTTGTKNVASGYQALYANLTGSSNTAFGYKALYNNTGGENTAVGYEALLSNTTGASGCAFGRQALRSNLTGLSNIAIGERALYTNTAGHWNIGIGWDALKVNTVSFNTAIGYNAGIDITTGAENVLIGKSAGGTMTTGESNICIGKEAGDNILTGSFNIVIGENATASSTSVSNELTLGDTGISSFRCNQQSISSLSDGRDKTEVEDLPLGLDFIDTLRPVKFKWDTRDGNCKDGSFEAGFIAQDLQSAQSTSNADYLKMVMDENPDRLEAAYGQLIPVLVQAIKDLKSEIETLKSNA